MRKINLKCGGYVFVEEYDDHEEDERCKIYDVNDNYLDYISLPYCDDILNRAYYDKMVEYLETCEDIHNYLGTIFIDYVYGKTLKELIVKMGTIYNMYNAEINDYLHDLSTLSEHDFCANYCINKIGDLYILGDC